MQYPYRYLVLAILVFLSIVNGSSWGVATPIALTISHAYQETAFVVSLIPLVYVLTYAVASFPSSFLVDSKGLRFSILLAALSTMVGCAIRCLVPAGMAFVIIGQVFNGFGQAMIINSNVKFVNRWFLP